MDENRNRYFPSFKKPPVVEVALTVQFQKLNKLRSFQMSDLWRMQFRERLPRVEERPARDPVFEQFDNQARGRHQFQLEIDNLESPNAYWFTDPERNELVRIQQDLFGHNWLKGPNAEDYPRYEQIKYGFQDNLERLSEFLSAEGLGDLRPNQCEISYVNHIPAGEGWNDLSDLHKVFKMNPLQRNNSGIEAVSYADTLLLYRDTKPVGRLHTKIETATRNKDGVAILRLSLTGRGLPVEAGVKGILPFFDLARSAIVRNFTEITTDDMHRIWERVQ